MKTQYVYPDNTPVPNGKRVKPDNYVTTISVTIRALKPLTGEDLKQIVQKAGYEVIHQPEVNKSLAVCLPA